MADDRLDRARELVAQANVLVGFTGAGVSTASGIPDFRGPGGLWTRFDPEEFTYDRFQADPARFWRMRTELTRALRLDEAKPNPCHEAMASAVGTDRMEAIVTQNIDGLHQAAGTPDDRVIEVHGTTRHARCVACRDRVPIAAALDKVDLGEVPPTCEACGGTLKPDVVLFGEVLPMAELRRAEALAGACDVMLVAGSSLGVWPAAGIPHHAVDTGASLVIVNGDATPMDGLADVVVRGRVEDLVPRLFG